MSSFLGPFGRMLPAINGPSEQGLKNPGHPLISGNGPYQLPPPQAPAPLRFGTDPFMRQRTPVEKNDAGIGRHWTDGGTQNEQLPSVSQLLTPVSRSSAPPHHHTQPFATSTPSHGTQGSYASSLSSSVSTVPVHERLTYQQHDSLPPIDHIPVRNQGEMRPRPHGSPVLPFRRELSNQDMSRYKGDTRSSETIGNPASSGSKTPLALPHIVDERYIDGDGLCYVYSDGSYCPKSIDGMPVNANWGITKAGKPRKRLAQACLTCREKKIKCHPNLPRCDQCQKSGRVCRFENAPRGNRRPRSEAKGTFSRGSPDPSSSIYITAPASETSTSLPDTSGDTPDSDTSMRTPSCSYSRESRMEQLYNKKKRRMNRAARDGSSKHSMASNVEAHTLSDYPEILMGMTDLDSANPLTREWNTDPYEADPELTTHYIETYFTYVNDNLYPMFPRPWFLLWLKSDETKTLDDKMLLYWMLAVGCVFSDRPDRLLAMKRYARTAQYTVEHHRNTLTLQLAQSRILMSIWYYAIGALLKSWDSIGAAVRIVCGLRYNIESGGVIVDQSHVCEYGLHPQALIECRRRTFWVAFLMDRFSSFYSPSSNFIPSQKAAIRFPCREEVYEAQAYATVPYFQTFMNKAPLSTDDLSALSTMTFLIEIMSLWGDVSDEGFRLSLIPAEAYGSKFEDFYAVVIQRSDEWATKLPEDLRITAANMEKNSQAKRANAFISNHLFYHATLLKLNRYVRYQDLQGFTVDQCIRRARHHSIEILRICLALTQYTQEYESSRPITEPTPVSFRTTMALNPFLGYIVLSAVDVLSAAGPMTDMAESINLIRGGLEMARELSRFWDGARPLVSLIETRVDAMVDALQGSWAKDKLGFMMDGSGSSGSSLDEHIRADLLKHSQPGPVGQDLMYGGLSRERLLSALGINDAALSKDNILWYQECH